MLEKRIDIKEYSPNKYNNLESEVKKRIQQIDERISELNLKQSVKSNNSQEL